MVKKFAMTEDAIRKIVRDIIENELKEKEIDETSVTGDAAVYLTPAAFVGKKGKERKRKWLDDMIKKIEYEKVGDEEEGDELGPGAVKRSNYIGINEGRRGQYQMYKDDPRKTAQQKIGDSIQRIRKSLKEINREVDLNLRLKKESGIDSDLYWKRTRNDLFKISEHIFKLLEKIRRF